MLEKYNKIKTPEELLDFMDKYIKYGLVDENNKVYEWHMVDFQEACQKNGSLKVV